MATIPIVDPTISNHYILYLYDNLTPNYCKFFSCGEPRPSSIIIGEPMKAHCSGRPIVRAIDAGHYEVVSMIRRLSTTKNPKKSACFGGFSLPENHCERALDYLGDSREQPLARRRDAADSIGFGTG